MKVGIFGGAFDPPHIEHINICLKAKDELNLDKVILVPSGKQPHKDSKISAKERCEMVKLAIEGINGLEVDDIEIDFDKTAYAVDILPLLKEKYGNIVYIIGGDSFSDLRIWYKPEILLKNYEIAVVSRNSNQDTILKLKKSYEKDFNAKINVLNFLTQNISSTKLRAMFELKEFKESLVAESVVEFILQNNLYSDYENIVLKLKNMVSERLFNHIKRTVYKALEINTQTRLPFRKVFLSALLHDCAKERGLEKKYEDLVPDDVKNTPVMHAFLGAIIAKEEYGIDDIEIINSIKYHTTGKADMTPLEMIIYTADMVEDNRRFDGVDYLREKVRENYRLGFIECVKRTIEYLKKNVKDINPLTLESYNYYKKEIL